MLWLNVFIPLNRDVGCLGTLTAGAECRHINSWLSSYREIRIPLDVYAKETGGGLELFWLGLSLNQIYRYSIFVRTQSGFI